jgi:hypothetical protein
MINALVNKCKVLAVQGCGAGFSLRLTTYSAGPAGVLVMIKRLIQAW